MVDLRIVESPGVGFYIGPKNETWFDILADDLKEAFIFLIGFEKGKRVGLDEG